MDYGYVLKMAVAPLALLAAAALLGWFFRRSILRSMNLSVVGIPLDTQSPAAVQICLTSAPLSIRRLELSGIGKATGQAAVALSATETIVRATRLAYEGAAIAYSAIATSAWVMALTSADPRFPADLAIGMIYIMQCLPLIILVHFLRVSRRVQLAILGGYLIIGLGLASLEPNFSRAVTIANTVSAYFLLYPLVGLLLLLARPLRPWLFGLAAILVYVLTVVAVSLLLPLEQRDWRGLRPWLVASLGFIFLAAAIVFVGWVLTRRSWQRPVAGLLCLAILGISVIRLLPDSMIGYVLMALPSNVLQVFFVCLVFKMFVQLQHQEFLPAQVLHSHLCWGFLTFYYLLSALGYSGLPGWAPLAIVSAYVLYLALFHSLLRRIWSARVSNPGKRLLLLRVFGTAQKSERLLDLLDDTWRYVGRIDLIAGTDLAVRTLGSRMLEAFLLRHADDQFLKTNEDVDRRLEKLDSRLEGDASYPINSIYCYTTSWRHAVQRLGPESDAVLMDLRGFTREHQGCIFELNWLIQQIRLSRIILLTDTTTDHQALEEEIQTAWMHLSVESPNAYNREPMLTILNGAMRSKDSGRSLAISLLRAAYQLETGAC
jgi:hypothetical protein